MQANCAKINNESISENIIKWISPIQIGTLINSPIVCTNNYRWAISIRSRMVTMGQFL